MSKQLKTSEQKSSQKAQYITVRRHVTFLSMASDFWRLKFLAEERKGEWIRTAKTQTQLLIWKQNSSEYSHLYHNGTKHMFFKLQKLRAEQQLKFTEDAEPVVEAKRLYLKAKILKTKC